MRSSPSNRCCATISYGRVLLGVIGLSTLVCLLLSISVNKTDNSNGLYMCMVGFTVAMMIVGTIMGFLGTWILDLITLFCAFLCAIFLSVAASCLTNVSPYMLKTSVWLAIATLYIIQAIVVGTIAALDKKHEKAVRLYNLERLAEMVKDQLEKENVKA
ncbi:hypothetical protein Ciccas_012841 [Cichlidogyrus casuarinus]|uniref:Uncharacterized protein n=1 Tax=Cichlidogyrus casuarinus TaxID=1844966 RepID=A0ABD2PM99_9PLAT